MHPTADGADYAKSAQAWRNQYRPDVLARDEARNDLNCHRQWSDPRRRASMGGELLPGQKDTTQSRASQSSATSLAPEPTYHVMNAGQGCSSLAWTYVISFWLKPRPNNAASPPLNKNLRRPHMLATKHWPSTWADRPCQTILKATMPSPQYGRRPGHDIVTCYDVAPMSSQSYA